MEPSPEFAEELSAKQKFRACAIWLALLFLGGFVCAALAAAPIQTLWRQWQQEKITLLAPTPTSTPVTIITPTPLSVNTPYASFTVPPHLPTNTAPPVAPAVYTPTPTYTLASISATTVLSAASPEAISPPTSTPSPAPSADALLVGGPVKGDIELIELPASLQFNQDTLRVEFKWVWKDKGCQPPPNGQGFEVRIWPERPGFGPLGVMDAADQDAIFCDEKSGTRMFAAGNLRSAPGVMAVDGGPFRWDVALVQLDPYIVLNVAPSRAFYLPPAAPAFTPTPTPPRAASIGGRIDLLEPPNNQTLPPGAEKVEFRWRWSQSPACQLPPPGYGFELRVWPSLSNAAPMGAMGNAAENQAQIFCDPTAGLFSYQVPNINLIPATKERGSGDYRWDVILTRLTPYSPTLFSEVRVFWLPEN